MSAQSMKPGWKMVKFGDIAQNIAVRIDPAEATTDVYVGLEHLDPETLHLRQWGHPSDVTGQKLVFKKGDVIFGRRRAYQRKLAVAEFDGICSAHAMVVRAKPEMILPEFLPFFLQSDMFMERAIEISVGSLSPTINWKTLRIQEFPLPPIKEQKRIAEILWAADEAVEKWMSVLEPLKAVSGLMIQKYLREKSDGTIKLVDTKVQIIDGDRGKNYPKASEYLNQDLGYCLFLNAKNVTDQGFSFIENQFISKEKDQILRKGKMQRKDIALTTRGTVGNVALYDETVQFENMRINSGMVILRNATEAISTEFLYRLFISEFVQKQIQRMSYGSAQPQLSVKVIQQIKIPKFPLQEQKSLLKILTDIDKQIGTASFNIENIRQVSKTYWEQLMSRMECIHV
jgi:restriction endonuclease S subunit